HLGLMFEHGFGAKGKRAIHTPLVVEMIGDFHYQVQTAAIDRQRDDSWYGIGYFIRIRGSRAAEFPYPTAINIDTGRRFEVAIMQGQWRVLLRQPQRDAVPGMAECG